MKTWPRVQLRHVQATDLPLMIRAITDPAWRGEFSVSRITSPETLRKRFADHGFATEESERLMVCNEAGEVVGDVVHFVAHRYSDAREIGWSIYDPALRGQGYGTAAARALVDYLFQAFPIHRLSCSMAPDNRASVRVAHNAGFQYEGRLRGLVFVRGQYLDGEVYGLTRPDWQAGMAATAHATAD